ncbi:MAG TPA: hypothetical protein VLB73_02040 [Patescibacteria group bacterium]|nr:hypothetical protein [Patescibacteria group bacterium]
MANLSRVSDVTRKLAEILGIGIVALILLMILFRVGTFVKELISPTPPKAPTVAFGKLPVLSFPKNFDNKTYSYTINTLSGSLPTLPDRITVYKLQQPAPNLLGLDKAKSIAAEAGFTDQPTPISDTEYRWLASDPFPSMLTMDIQSFDFTYTSDYRNNPTVVQALHVPDGTTAQTVSKAFFAKIIPLPDSIDDSKTKTTLFAISPSGLSPASSLSTAQIIRVDYFPKSIDNIPVYTANPDKSLFYTLVASGDTDFPQVVEAQYYHKDPTKNTATYPILSVQQAYADLQQGKGYVAANPTGDTSITITDVSLGYYVDATSQQYLWPIIVFQGDKGFYAYVSAVSSDWIQK